ncbi:MAG: Flp pilus assembly protein CpaB [Sphingomonadaceae bacterium]|nr:Flp pilus assembly protein CpaB [Sphingomonadaceae bacterium]
MDVKKLALLVGALVVAAITAVMAKNMFTGAAAPQAQAAPVETGPEVLVATQPLPVGTILQEGSFRFQPWPKDLVGNAYFVKGQPGVDPLKLAGTVVRTEITAGQPLTQGALVKPGDRGFLAAALSPGMRAMTVSVSAASGVAGFVFPGDRVDLVLTSDVQGGGNGPPLKVSETIVRNLRVLATDQRTNSKDDEGKTDVKTFSTVTMEATPKIAEKIAVAQTLGQLSLSLRSIADNSADLQKALASGETTVATANSKDPKAPQQVLLPIASRPLDTDTTYTTGGEVSRFQRNTVPGKAGPSGPQMAANGQPQPGAAPAVPTGPSVKVARGSTITVVPLGGK